MKADVYTSTSIMYGSGVTLYSPLNKTYNTDTPLLNLTFGKGTGLQCTLSYSIDDQNYNEIPLTVLPVQDQHIITQTAASLWLPKLEDGSHCIVINVNASEGNYQHSWTHTIYFSVDTSTKTASLATKYSGGVVYSSGLYLYTPINRTYSSNPLTLSCIFKMGGVQTKLNYSLDSGVYSGDIPITYFNCTETMLMSNYEGSVQLPKLADGSHCLTITVDSELNDYRGASPPGAPFKATNAEGTNYAAVWVHTVYFTIDTTASTPNPTETATPTPLPAETNATPTMQAPAGNTQVQSPILPLIIAAAIVTYIAVIVVLIKKNGK